MLNERKKGSEVLDIYMSLADSRDKKGSFGTMPCIEESRTWREGIPEPWDPDLGTFSSISRPSILRSANCHESVVGEEGMGLECQKTSWQGESWSLEVEGNISKYFQSCWKCQEPMICELYPYSCFTPLTFVQGWPAQML